MGVFKSIDTDEFIKLKNKGVAVIDIRRPEEWEATGIIEGSVKNTFFDANGGHDIRKWMKEFEKHVSDKSQPVILVCAHANRTKSVGRFLSDELGMQEVYDLEGGIVYGWIDKGKTTVK